MLAMMLADGTFGDNWSEKGGDRLDYFIFRLHTTPPCMEINP